MAGKTMSLLLSILISTSIVLSVDTAEIPADKAQLDSWFQGIVQPPTKRKPDLDPTLATAEEKVKVIKLKSDGSGDFLTINEAINSIPDKNTQRHIIVLGTGNYTEKVRIERNKPFVTLYGEDPENMPSLVFNGTALEYGTVNSATLIVEAKFFSAVNLKIINSAPPPDGKRRLAQAAALRTSGDMASFYNCRIYGYQDTLCDDKGKHFFKDCYIEGTVDFIFGSGKSLYLNTELHVIPGRKSTMITAQARKNDTEDTGYCFVHCTVTGPENTAFLGRSWMPAAKVVVAYTEMTNVVKPEGWIVLKPEHESTVNFWEYKNKGAGANMDNRVKIAKELTDEEAKPFLSLNFIEASKWLLPPEV